MLNKIIHFSLNNKLFILLGAALLIVGGAALVILYGGLNEAYKRATGKNSI